MEDHLKNNLKNLQLRKEQEFQNLALLQQSSLQELINSIYPVSSLKNLKAMTYTEDLEFKLLAEQKTVLLLREELEASRLEKRELETKLRNNELSQIDSKNECLAQIKLLEDQLQNTQKANKKLSNRCKQLEHEIENFREKDEKSLSTQNTDRIPKRKKDIKVSRLESLLSNLARKKDRKMNRIIDKLNEVNSDLKRLRTPTKPRKQASIKRIRSISPKN